MRLQLCNTQFCFAETKKINKTTWLGLVKRSKFRLICSPLMSWNLRCHGYTIKHMDHSCFTLKSKVGHLWGTPNFSDPLSRYNCVPKHTSLSVS